MRVSHIRKTFGDDLDIAVDAATRYDLLDIPDVLRYCEENRVYWLEEPFTPDNIPAYAELRTRTANPHRRRREPLCEAGLPRALRGAGDLNLPGRFLQVGRAQRAQEDFRHGCRLAHPDGAAHTSHSILSAAGNAHLLSAIPNGLIYEADVAAVNPFPQPTSPRVTRAWSTAISSRRTGRASGSRSTRRCWSAIPRFRGPATSRAGPAHRAERPRRGEGAHDIQDRA